MSASSGASPSAADIRPKDLVAGAGGLAPVVLEGRRVRLEPLSLSIHWDGLLAIGTDPELWKWTISVCDTPAKLRAYLEAGLEDQSRGRALPFATRDLVSGEIAGSTRYVEDDGFFTG